MNKFYIQYLEELVFAGPLHYLESMSIEENVRKIQEIVRRRPGARLLAVTKKRSPEEIEAVLQCGVKMIGENRVQEAAEKLPHLSLGAEKHFIGHLQENKVKKAVQIFDAIESVDSVKLAVKIGREAEAIGKVMPIYLQVNISREEQKSGFLEENLSESYSKIDQLIGVKISGIMCIPKLSNKLSETRESFRSMKTLHTKIIQDFRGNNSEKFELSMGMSEDYEIALEEGATIVRIGSALFE